MVVIHSTSRLSLLHLVTSVFVLMLFRSTVMVLYPTVFTGRQDYDCGLSSQPDAHQANVMSEVRIDTLVFFELNSE